MKLTRFERWTLLGAAAAGFVWLNLLAWTFTPLTRYKTVSFQYNDNRTGSR